MLPELHAFKVLFYAESVSVVTSGHVTKMAVTPLMQMYTMFQKSDAKIQITITTAYLIRIKYPLSGFN